MRKKGTKNKKYSAEFKIAVIMDMRKAHLGYCETVRKYRLGSTRSGGAIQNYKDGNAYIQKKVRKD